MSTEVNVLVERLEGPTVLRSDHISKFLDGHGRIPEDKTSMLAVIDQALKLTRSNFRPATEKLVDLTL